ncbi:MAG: aminopeptidase P family protein [Acidobacteria bacterium]|nr:aminopeptidase P family protein [Acidobacteriota bacterium]
MTAAKHLVLAATAIALVVGVVSPSAQSAISFPDPAARVLTHREQNELVTPWVSKRFDTLLPGLMTREGIDMWIIPTREYNEDPVFASMSPLTYFASRRRTILVFYNPGGGRPVERYSIGRFDYDRIYTPIPTSNDGQHEGLRKLVEEKQPKVIGINESDAWNHADGITANEKRRLLEALGPAYAARVKSAEMLAVGWLEVKLPEELEAYRHAMKVAHMVIREAFSNKVITPGKTTSQDVVWWMRQRVAELGLGSWFQPSINIARRGEKGTIQGVIQPGDMLHTDFGIVYMGFSTDTQHNAYVLRPGETDAPQGLKDGLKAANRLQDLTMQYARLERTGNEALADALAHAKKEGLVPSIYCHAIGYHGHGAGPPIGMTDYQSGVPVRGDYVFRPDTWHSIELNATHRVPEWDNQPVRFALEEDAALMPGGKWDWIDGRQTEFYLIRP